MSFILQCKRSARVGRKVITVRVIRPVIWVIAIKVHVWVDRHRFRSIIAWENLNGINGINTRRKLFRLNLVYQPKNSSHRSSSFRRVTTFQQTYRDKLHLKVNDSAQIDEFLHDLTIRARKLTDACPILVQPEDSTRSGMLDVSGAQLRVCGAIYWLSFIVTRKLIYPTSTSPWQQLHLSLSSMQIISIGDCVWAKPENVISLRHVATATFFPSTLPARGKLNEKR